MTRLFVLFISQSNIIQDVTRQVAAPVRRLPYYIEAYLLQYNRLPYYIEAHIRSQAKIQRFISHVSYF